MYVTACRSQPPIKYFEQFQSVAYLFEEWIILSLQIKKTHIVNSHRFLFFYKLENYKNRLKHYALSARHETKIYAQTKRYAQEQ
jgi:hypothetical protein